MSFFGGWSFWKVSTMKAALLAVNAANVVLSLSLLLGTRDEEKISPIHAAGTAINCFNTISAFALMRMAPKVNISTCCEKLRISALAILTMGADVGRQLAKSFTDKDLKYTISHAELIILSLLISSSLTAYYANRYFDKQVRRKEAQDNAAAAEVDLELQREEEKNLERNVQEQASRIVEIPTLAPAA